MSLLQLLEKWQLWGLLVMLANGPGCISGVVKIHTMCRYPNVFCSSSLKVSALDDR